jgi:hypothetical protein
MLAYKFLARGAVSPFQGVAWPRPDSGRWLEAGSRDVATEGIHACRVPDLAYWLQHELWRVELAGALREAPFQVVAERGRLVEEVTAWREGGASAFAETCAIRAAAAAARAHVAGAERAAGMAVVGGAGGAGGGGAAPRYIAAAVAELLAPPARAQEAFAAERAWQAAWLARELDLE